MSKKLKLVSILLLLTIILTPLTSGFAYGVDSSENKPISLDAIVENNYEEPGEDSLATGGQEGLEEGENKADERQHKVEEVGDQIWEPENEFDELEVGSERFVFDGENDGEIHLMQMQMSPSGSGDLSVEEVVGALRSYYSNRDEFSFGQALAYNYTSNNLGQDLLEIACKIVVDEGASSAAGLAGNVIAIIAGGENPYDYGGSNYVEKLVTAFDPDDWPTSLAFRMLALDMAGVQYDRELALEAFVNSQDEQGKWGGDWGGPDEAGMVITALAKYKDRPSVEGAINKALNYLEGIQDENTGGFIVWGSENPYSASAVIQGLIAVGEDPTSEKWSRNGKNIVDSLLNFYEDGYFVYNSNKDEMLTEQAFLALADLYRGKSVFNEIKFIGNKVARIVINKPNIDKIIEGETINLNISAYDAENKITFFDNVEWTSSDPEIAQINENGNLLAKQPGQVTISAQVGDVRDSILLEIHKKEFEIEYIGDLSVRNGQEVKAKVKLNNLTDQTKSATLIITLYEKQTNKLLNYSIAKKDLQAYEDLELGAGFLLPETGNFYIKAFVWDDLEEQNIMMGQAQNISVLN